MALRAGYYGLKNSVKKKLEKLAADMAGAKIIKSFGDGLDLTNAGKLNLTAATASKLGGVKVGVGLEIVNGKLNVTATGSLDYSLEEQNTGVKWIDGKDIFQKTLVFDSLPANGTTLISGVNDVINAYGEQLYTGSGTARYYHFPYPDLRWELAPSTHNITLLNSTSGSTTCKWTFFYTKYEEE